jgi:CheY-like chemotaxis protein
MIRLPALTDRVEREESRSQHEIPAFNPTQQFRILVVDDNVDAADSMAELLRLTGQQVAVAYDGLSALNAAQANPWDIIFLDIGMPKMNGLEVARKLRQHPGLKNVLLVALTGWGQKEDRRRSQEAGFDLHLVKPVEPAMLQQLLADPNLLSRDFPSP